MFWFLIMTFDLCFYHQLWVKWAWVHIRNNYAHIEQTQLPFLKFLWMHDTMNEMLLASLIICSINDNLTNTLSTPPLEVKKKNTVLNTFNNFAYLNSNFHLLVLSNKSIWLLRYCPVEISSGVNQRFMYMVLFGFPKTNSDLELYAK